MWRDLAWEWHQFMRAVDATLERLRGRPHEHVYREEIVPGTVWRCACGHEYVKLREPDQAKGVG